MIREIKIVKISLWLFTCVANKARAINILMMREIKIVNTIKIIWKKIRVCLISVRGNCVKIYKFKTI